MTPVAPQEKPGPGGVSAATVRGGPLRAGKATVQLPHQALSGHARASAAADQHVLAQPAQRAHLHAHAHLPGQPPQLCNHPTLRLARAGTSERCRVQSSCFQITSDYYFKNLRKSLKTERQNIMSEFKIKRLET